MNIRRSLRAFALSCAATAAVLGYSPVVSAQATSADGAVVAELQRIQEQLAAIERRAVTETPVLQQRHRELEERVIAAMTAVDPSTPANIARLQAMPAEVASAEQQNDQSRLQELAGEAHSLREKLNRAQQAAFENEDVASAVATYQNEVLQRMVELEPQTEQLLARARDLIRTLQPQG
ncbi:MAG TPA: hypothetical protein VNZ57_09445 [Longimicrobiales bacterium]|nr:hypothetical protein [Longimicrobiales bacterium]